MDKEEMISKINKMDCEELIDCILFLLRESPKFKEHLSRELKE